LLNFLLKGTIRPGEEVIQVARNPPTNFVIPGVYQFFLEVGTYLIFFVILNIPMVAGLSCLSAALPPLPNVDDTQHGLNFELDLYKQVVSEDCHRMP
jgi:hypothetical protein